MHVLPGTKRQSQSDVTYFHLPNTIHKIITKCHQTPLNRTKWRFDRTTAAAEANTKLLQSFDYNVHNASQATPNSTLTYGSEFRPTAFLHLLFRHHHHWPLIRNIIENGVTYPVTPIPEETRLSDIDYQLQRGNHKSTSVPENAAALEKAFDKEVKFNWAIPLSPQCIKSIPHACVTPLGVAVQWTIDADNNRILKRRTTHDCTFPGPSGASCNNRVIIEDLPPCSYGHALSRFLHGIHAMRHRHPTKRILMNKTDMDAAYRRIHTNASASVLCITVLNHIAYLLGRLPFGSSPAPTYFSTVSDAIGDVAFDLALDPHWDPATLHSPFPIDITPRLEPSSVPIAPADTPAADLPPRDIVLDNFIDDSFNAGIEDGDIPLRLAHAVPLLLHAIFRPTTSTEKIPRNPIINFTKHKAEGKLEERKVILGWLVDTRRFRLFLTVEKALDWLRDIDNAIKDKMCTKEVLESLIGRFNHTGTIIHISRYFLTRLRHRLQKNLKHRSTYRIHLSTPDIDDLRLWKSMITLFKTQGVSINNVCNTQPSATTYSDACEWGLGGFSSHGTAWRYRIPDNLHHRASINFLEFLGAIATIKLSLLTDNHNTAFPSILSFSDNSSAVGWLYHSTFSPASQTHHDNLARDLATTLFNHQATVHPEHIPGRHNDVADSLSRDFHMSTPHLTSFLLTLPQAPSTLTIVPLPPTISSWIASTLESLPPKVGSPLRPKPSSAAILATGSSSSTNAASRTHSSVTTPSPNANSSSSPSGISKEQTPSIPPTKEHTWATLSAPPYQQWFRGSGRTFSLTPLGTQPEHLAPSSNANSGPTGTTTHHKSVKHASPSPSGNTL